MLPLHQRRGTTPPDADAVLGVDDPPPIPPQFAGSSTEPEQAPLRASRREENPDAERDEAFGWIAGVQAVSYIITGLWALLSIRSFVWVTGPKTDIWLVKTVAVLVLSIGGALGVAARRRAPSEEIAFLGASSAAMFVAIEVTYVAQRRIRPLYLIDTVQEAAFAAAWLAWYRGYRKSRSDERTLAVSATPVR